jgi:NAD(P)-dependent dehydrogenase (short-subunit alcohol dehydrogenase family)
MHRSVPPALAYHRAREDEPVLDFKDQVVLVTGAGIGFGIARAFQAAGARVAVGDVREAALKRTLSRLGEAGVHGAMVANCEATRFGREGDCIRALLC